MRHVILLSFIGLSLSACGKKESSQDIQQVDQSLANDNLVDNDLTAIDAITGADAGMAADVDAATWSNNDGEVLEGGNVSTSSTTRRIERPAPSRNGDDNKQEAAPSTPATPAAPAAGGNSSNDEN